MCWSSSSSASSELSIATLCHACGRGDDTANWLCAALTTARDAEDISGGAALRRFLDLRPEGTLSAAERALCHDVISKSCSVLRHPGEPDLGDLRRAAERLVQLGSQAPAT